MEVNPSLGHPYFDINKATKVSTKSAGIIFELKCDPVVLKLSLFLLI